MADTMRSIAVLIAASVSWYFNLNPSLADATAALIVSGIIALSLGPLIVGLIQTWNELMELREEERRSKEANIHISWLEQYQHLPSVSPHLLPSVSPRIRHPRLKR